MGERPRHEVAEVLERYLNAPSAADGLGWSWRQLEVADRITACRTARLGGHVGGCDGCGHREIFYNSCRDRHCPKCQGPAEAAWIEARRADVLPVPYAHVVFTLPQILAPLALQNPKVVYDLLLRTSARTLQEVAANPRHLGARLGFFAQLHTWGQTLVHHPHVHCVAPTGGLAPDGTWRACRPGFFLPVRVLSRVFRGKFLAGLHDAFDQGRLEFHGALRRYRGPGAFRGLLHESRRTEWVVYAKPPFEDPAHVIAYLARYTHRIAISNYRILHVDDDSVTFRYNDYRGRRGRTLTLSHAEFARRFLLHVLPKGFVRVRHYGLLANSSRAQSLARCRAALDVPTVQESDTPRSGEPDSEGRDFIAGLLPTGLRLCPNCRKRTLRRVEILPRAPPLPLGARRAVA